MYLLTWERRKFHVGVADTDWMFPGGVPLIYLIILMQNGSDSATLTNTWEALTLTVGLYCYVINCRYIEIIRE